MDEREKFSSYTDEQLAVEACSDPEAASELTSRMFPSIRSLALGIDPQIWDDLVQEGLLGMFSAIGSYDERRGRFKTYALACARNRMLSTVKQNSLLNSGDDKTDELPDKSQESGIESREQFYALYNAVERLLSATERKVLECYMKGCSYSETARRLGISVKSVDNAMQRARKKLREEFK